MAQSPQDIATAAGCFNCFGPISTAQSYQIVLLAQIVANATGDTIMTPQEIATGAACFNCSNMSMADAAIIYLLNQVVAAGGGGGGGSGVTCGAYGGAEPSFTPSTSCGVAIDTDTGTIWWYYNGVWN